MNHDDTVHPVADMLWCPLIDTIEGTDHSACDLCRGEMLVTLPQRLAWVERMNAKTRT